MNKQHLYSINKKRYRHTNDCLTKEQVEKLFCSGEKAFYNKTPLNRFFTIHFDDFADRKKPQKFIVDFLECARKWLQRNGIQVAYIWTMENAPVKGLHAHLMIHIPEGFQVKFKQAMKNWLPFEYSKQRIDSKRTQYPIIGNLHPLNAMYGRLRYICKGIDKDDAIHGIESKHQGLIWGRRWGISKLLRGKINLNLPNDFDKKR